MIRKFIAQIIFIFLMTIPFTVSAQLDSVKYILVYDTTTCHYNVCIKIVGGSATTLGQRTQANSTISMVMAASDTMEIEQLYMPLRYNQTYTGTEPTTWNISTQVFAPAAQPESNFYTIVPSLSPASQYNNLATGDTIKLFSIRVWNKATGEPLLNCGRTIRFFRNGIDPGSGEPGMNSGDFSNGFTVGSFKQLYRGNLDPVTPPKPTLNYEINCTNDISLDLQPQTTLCQQPLKFGWSGPGYSSLSEDIMISPATFFNNGLYSVTVTDEYECEEILQIELERKPNAGTDIVLCGGGSTTLSASADNPGTWTPDPLNGPGANISNTSNPSTNVTFAPGSTGVYAFIYEASVCSDTVRVTILDAVSVNIVGDNQFCPGNSVTLSTDAGSDFVWSTGATTPSIDVSAPGTYRVTITDTDGCTATASHVVSALTPPNAVISGDDEVCQGGSVTFTASGGVSYEWSSGLPGASITVSDNSPQVVTVTDANGCTDTAEKSLIINPEPNASISGDDAVCTGGSATFTASGGVSYLWNTGFPGAIITVSDNSQKVVTVTDANGCTATAEKTLTINPQPIASISGDDEICDGNTATFIASGGNTYLWQSGSTSATISVSNNMTQVVTVTDANGCTATAEKTLTINPNPVASISGDNEVCDGGSVTFTASGGISYEWNLGTPGATIMVSDNSTQVVTVTDANGCTATAQKTLNILASPVAVISGDNEVCEGGSVTFTASGGVSYLWNSVTPGATIVVTHNTTQEVMVTDANGCTATAEKTLIINPEPIVSISGDDEVCDGGSVIFTANGGVTFLWSTGLTTPSITVSNNTAIVVTVTDANGCTATAEKTLLINSNPTASITGDDEVCDGGSVTFTANGGTSYSWSTGDNTPSISVSNNTPIIVTVTDANNCTATAEKTLTINPNPTASITGDDEVCDGGSVTFTANGGTSYSWSTGDNTPSISVSNNTPIVVTVTDANNCTATAEKTLIINSIPTASITGDDEVCNGGSVTFTANGGTSYSWSTGDNTPSISVSNNTPIVVTVTDANGCTDTATKTLTVHPVPDAGVDQSVNCYATDVATLLATGTGTWTLVPGPGTATITNSNAPNTNVSGFSGPGTYELIWSNGFCEDRVLIIVGNNCACPPGDNQITSPSVTEACGTYPATTIIGNDATPSGGSYIWEMETNGLGFVAAAGTNNQKDYTTPVLNPGTYRIRRIYNVMANGQDCVYESNIVQIEVYANPTASITGDDEVCDGGSVTFTANGGTSYSWSTGDNTPNISVSNNTRIVVTVTDANNCTATAEKTLIINSNPTASITGDNEVCDGGSVIFTANGGVTFLWSTGLTTPSITVSNNTPIVVTVTDANGCTSTAEKTLLINSIPTASITGDDEVCDGGSVTFTANGGTSYSWSTGDNTPSISVSNNTPIVVTVTDANNCTATAEKTLTINPNPTASITGDDEVCDGGSVTFTANGGTSYSWSTGDNTPSISVAINTPIVVTVTDANNCIATAEKSLTINSNPTASITGDDEVCNGGSVTFTANGGTSYSWSTGDNTPSISVSNNTPIVVTVTDANGCTDTATKTLTVYPVPNAGVDQSVNCYATDLATLLATGTGTWTLVPGPGTATITNSNAPNTTVSGFSGPGTYELIWSNGFCEDRVLIVVGNNCACPPGDNQITAPSVAESCGTYSATTIIGNDATPSGGSYVWEMETNGGGFVAAAGTNNQKDYTTPVLNPGIYRIRRIYNVMANGQDCVYESNIVQIEVYDNPVASITGDDEVCDGGSVTFTANGGTSYSWSTGDNTPSISVSNNTPIVVTVTDANNCTDTAEKTLTINTNPTASITGDDEVCDGGSVTFTANGGTSYSWSTGDNTQNISLSTSTSVVVTVTDANGCTSTAEKTLLINSIPTASITGDDEVCDGGSVTFTANGGTSYSWSTGDNTPSISVSNNTPIVVTVTDANNCTATAEKTLTINPNPTASITGDDEVCDGGSVTFTANGGTSYSWSTGDNTPSISVAINTPIVVTVTDANNCTATAEKSLTINSNPTASISGDDEVCDGGSVTFTANGGNTYLWGISNETTQSITVSTATTAIVTVTDANGCTDTAEKTLTVHPVPDAGPDVSLNCYVTDEAFLNAIGSGTWSYANGPGLPYILDVNQANTIVNNFPSPGTYDLIWSNGFCEDVMSITVGDLCDCPTGVNNISALSNTTACNEFPQTTITGNDATPFGGNYIWEISINGGAFANAPGSNVARDYITNVLNEGTYTFRRIYRVMANGQDCIYESNPITITVFPNPVATILGEDAVCAGQSTTFTANGGVTYDWGLGNTNAIITVSDNTPWVVTVTDINGCTATAQKTLTIHPNPIASITGDDFVCQGGSVDFTAEGGLLYSWNTTEATQTISVSDVLTKIVTVTDANGCTDTAEKSLNFYTNPTASITGDDFVCEGGSVDFTAEGGLLFSWNTTEATQTISVSDALTKIVTVTDINGCTATAEKTLTVHPVPDAGSDISVNCYVSDVVSMNANGSGTWSQGIVSGTFIITDVNNANTTISGFSAPGAYQFYWSSPFCEDVVTITVGDNCDCPSGDNQILAPALTEICFEFPATQILGNDASPAGGSYEWQINANNSSFVSAGGINNTKDYTTEVLPVGNYIIKRVYTVFVNGQDCIYESNPVNITVHPNPVATISGAETVCLGESTTFTATGGTDYLWSTGPNTQSITLFTASTVMVTVTDANGCTATAERTLTVNPNPVATISGDETVCLGESTTFTVNGGTDYLWSTGPNTPSITLSTASTVIVTVTDANGCTATSERTLTVNPNPVATISGDDAVCQGESTTFTASGGTDYLWSTGPNTQSITLSTASTVIVTVTDANGCTATAERTLTVNPLPNAGPDRSANCYVSDVVTLAATGTGSWSWAVSSLTATINNATSATTTISGFPSAGTYTLIWSDGNCEDVVNITVGDNCDCPSGDNQIFAPALTEICQSYPATLITGNDASPAGGSYEWQINANNSSFVSAGGINNTKDYTTEILPVGNYIIKRVYTVFVNGQDCIYESNPVNITVHPNPVATISGDETVCQGESSTFTASGGTDYLWSTGPNTPSITLFTASTVMVTVTDANGCTATAERTLTVNSNPVATISGDETVCLGESTTFTANGGTDYLWSTGPNTPSVTLFTSSTVVVTVTDANGCTATAERTLTVNPNPVATISGDDTVCLGESTTFTASGGTDYLWSTGPNTPSITLSTASTVIVTVTDANGCTATAERTLTVNPLPNAGPDRSANCYVSDVVTLAATGTGSWSWAVSSLTATINNTASATTTISGFPSAGTYTLIWSDGNCEDVVTITVGDNCDCPSGDNQIFAPALAEICFEFPATQILGNDASPAGGSYEWQINANNTGFVSAGGINNTKDYTTEILPVGNYIIKRVYTVFVNGQDCIYESNPVNITVHPNPVATISGDDTVCQGESTTFTAGGGTDYLWSTGPNTPSVTLFTSSTVFVTVTDANGCTATAERTLTVNPNPVATISGDETVCQGESTTFTANGGTDYLWSTGPNTPGITLSAASTVIVTVTDANGCTATAERTLTVNSNPVATISGDETVCLGESTTFIASGGTDYLWNTGPNTPSITLSAASTVIVTVTDANGCTATAERTLTVNPLPNAGPDHSANCYVSDVVTLAATGTGSWSWAVSSLTATINNTTSATTTVSGFPSAGTYTLIWSDGNCEDVVTITVGDNCDCPSGDNQIFAPAQAEICQSYPATVITGNDGSPAGGTYEWQINANNSSFVSAGGINNTKDYTTEILPVGNYIIKRVYTVFVNGQDCIYESNPVNITVHPNPVATISGDETVCLGESSTFTANGGTDYLWNTSNQTTQSITLFTSSTVVVTVTDANGCTATAERTLTVNPNPVATISGDESVCQGESSTFTASGGTDFLWSTGPNTPTITLSTGSTVIVSVTDANGCTATAERTLTVNPNPVATISGDETVCLGESTTFTANGGTDYLWSTGPNTPGITLSAASTVMVTVTDTNGCTATAEKTLTVNPLPNAGPDRSANCYVSDVVTLAATGTGSWSWAVSSLTATINNTTSATTTVSGFPSAGTYTLIWSDGNCEDVVTITVGDNCDCPSGDNQIIAPALTEICQSYPATVITGNDGSPAGGTYEWQINANNSSFVSAGGINNTKDYTTEILPVGNYIIRRVYTIVANGQDCIYESNPINITVNPNPVATISGDETVCLGESTTFTANGGVDYLWNTSNQTTQSITLFTSSTVVVTVTDANGCTATAERTLTVNANPVATISGDDAVCLGESTTFTASGGVDYLWSTGPNTPSITLSIASTVIVTVTDANGCTATAEKNIDRKSSSKCHY
ncbi:MAG: hypothetical protein IPN79_13385 [Saprospiraceae bacterium]|nr:hypothetical protein [Saprospiraceae bacterium]